MMWILLWKVNRMNYYTRTSMNTWKSIVRTCKSMKIELADIIIHTKYPINCERVFGFSEKSIQNVNCGLILHNYDCKEIVLNEYVKPDMFEDEEWAYLVPKLKENNLLDKPIQLFVHVPDPVRILEVITKNTKIFFYSNYSVRIVYHIQDDTQPSEFHDLFVDNGACLNAIYVRPYQRTATNCLHSIIG